MSDFVVREGESVTVQWMTESMASSTFSFGPNVFISDFSTVVPLSGAFSHTPELPRTQYTLACVDMAGQNRSQSVAVTCEGCGNIRDDSSPTPTPQPTMPPGSPMDEFEAPEIVDFIVSDTTLLQRDGQLLLSWSAVAMESCVIGAVVDGVDVPLLFNLPIEADNFEVPLLAGAQFYVLSCIDEEAVVLTREIQLHEIDVSTVRAGSGSLGLWVFPVAGVMALLRRRRMTGERS